MAGVTIDICLAFPAMQAVEAERQFLMRGRRLRRAGHAAMGSNLEVRIGVRKRMRRRRFSDRIVLGSMS